MKRTSPTALASVAAAASWAGPCDGVNVLTPAEKATGWELLFDGKTMKGWHGYNGKAVPAWSIDDCALKTEGTEGSYGSDMRPAGPRQRLLVPRHQAASAALSP
jgi:hypothetical protein